MTDNFYLALAAILLLPVIPAYILYKFLPASDTDVSGPYKGMNVKLKGAFAGYFLLVIVGLALQYVIMNSQEQRLIEQLKAQVAENDSTIARLQTQVNGAVTDWYIKGLLSPAGKEGTRFFYDDGTTKNEPDGSFELIKRTLGKDGQTKPPKWICIYNRATGFKVISLNRELAHPDISTYNVSFDDNKHEITIKKPIEINSIEKDSIVAIANYINKNAELKSKVLQEDPAIIQKAELIKREIQINQSKLKAFEKVQQTKKMIPK